MYIVVDHDNRALELRKDGGALALWIGVRITLFKTRKQASGAIAKTRRFAAVRGLPWKVSKWKIRPAVAA